MTKTWTKLNIMFAIKKAITPTNVSTKSQKTRIGLDNLYVNDHI